MSLYRTMGSLLALTLGSSCASAPSGELSWREPNPSSTAKYKDPAEKERFNRAAVAPGGKAIAAVEAAEWGVAKHRVGVLNVDQDTWQPLLDIVQGEVTRIEWDPSGRYLMCATRTSNGRRGVEIFADPASAGVSGSVQLDLPEGAKGCSLRFERWEEGGLFLGVESYKASPDENPSPCPFFLGTQLRVQLPSGSFKIMPPSSTVLIE